MQEYFPIVVQVIPLDNYHVQVFFDDGKIIDYDMSIHLQGDVFQPLNDIELFKNSCTVINGTLVWDLLGNRSTQECIDIDPFTLYYCPSINNEIA